MELTHHGWICAATMRSRSLSPAGLVRSSGSWEREGDCGAEGCVSTQGASS
jgi:hypothetical protein